VGGVENLFEDRRRLAFARDGDDQAQRQVVVNDSLPDVQNFGAEAAQDSGEAGGQPGPVLAGDVDQEDFLQGFKGDSLTFILGPRSARVR
jgi:hypothetical protein